MNDPNAFGCRRDGWVSGQDWQRDPEPGDILSGVVHASSQFAQSQYIVAMVGSMVFAYDGRRLVIALAATDLAR